MNGESELSRLQLGLEKTGPSLPALQRLLRQAASQLSEAEIEAILRTPRWLAARRRRL